LPDMSADIRLSPPPSTVGFDTTPSFRHPPEITHDGVRPASLVAASPCLKPLNRFAMVWSGTA
jgi:hypothetical protein